MQFQLKKFSHAKIENNFANSWAIGPATLIKKTKDNSSMFLHFIFETLERKHTVCAPKIDKFWSKKYLLILAPHAVFEIIV